MRERPCSVVHTGTSSSRCPRLRKREYYNSATIQSHPHTLKVDGFINFLDVLFIDRSCLQTATRRVHGHIDI